MSTVSFKILFLVCDLDRYKIHDIEIVIDRFSVDQIDEKRILNAINTSFEIGEDIIMVYDYDSDEIKSYSRNLVCPSTGISYPEPEPNLFSFNSPYGACSFCNGLGINKIVDFEKVIPDKQKSIKEGGIVPLGSFRNNWIFNEINELLELGGYDIDTPIGKIDAQILGYILNGTKDLIEGNVRVFEGVLPFLKRQTLDKSRRIQRWAESYTTIKTCSSCNGDRLNESANYFRIADKNISEISKMSMSELNEWTCQIEKKSIISKKKLPQKLLKKSKRDFNSF